MDVLAELSTFVDSIGGSKSRGCASQNSGCDERNLGTATITHSEFVEFLVAVRLRDLLVSDRIPWTGSSRGAGIFKKSAGIGSGLVADNTKSIQ